MYKRLGQDERRFWIQNEVGIRFLWRTLQWIASDKRSFRVEGKRIINFTSKFRDIEIFLIRAWKFVIFLLRWNQKSKGIVRILETRIYAKKLI
jgi:hypothetical protein